MSSWESTISISSFFLIKNYIKLAEFLSDDHTEYFSFSKYFPSLLHLNIPVHRVFIRIIASVRAQNRHMGNQGSVPKQSNEDWIVLTVPKSCKLQCCGYFELPTDNIDGRLVQNIYQQGEGGKGLVPKVRKLASEL